MLDQHLHEFISQESGERLCLDVQVNEFGEEKEDNLFNHSEATAEVK